jgi:hypothetical protein
LRRGVSQSSSKNLIHPCTRRSCCRQGGPNGPHMERFLTCTRRRDPPLGSRPSPDSAGAPPVSMPRCGGPGGSIFQYNLSTHSRGLLKPPGPGEPRVSSPSPGRGGRPQRQTHLRGIQFAMSCKHAHPSSPPDLRSIALSTNDMRRAPTGRQSMAREAQEGTEKRLSKESARCL